MCEGAEKIQKAWKPKFGDYVKEKQYGDLMIIAQIVESHDIRCISYRYRKTGYKSERYLKSNFIYLPTQEQLQEMILNHGHHGYDNSGIATMLSLFSMDYKLEDLTFTELWLAYVMKEKYNKIWNGKEWINETT